MACFGYLHGLFVGSLMGVGLLLPWAAQAAENPTEQPSLQEIQQEGSTSETSEHTSDTVASAGVESRGVESTASSQMGQKRGTDLSVSATQAKRSRSYPSGNGVKHT